MSSPRLFSNLSCNGRPQRLHSLLPTFHYLFNAIFMAGSTSQTVILARNVSSKSDFTPSSRFLTIRTQSTQSSSTDDLNDLDSSSSNVDPLIRKLEDAIHRIMVRRSAPDWLPFYPGASYWVPPPRSTSNGFAQLLDKLANPMTEDDSMSVTSVRGWPSSSYFIHGAASRPMEVETTSNCNSQSEDEEG